MSNPPRKTEVFLQPGEYFVGNAIHRLRTMLGSCVAITLWEPDKRLGGMSHFLLATHPAGVSGDALDTRYGDAALELMIRDLNEQAIDVADCEAKIFGGGNMFPEYHVPGHRTVGRRNGEAARQLLSSRGIPVVREHLFGEGHRQVIFDVESGEVWMRHIPLAVAAVVSAATQGPGEKLQ